MKAHDWGILALRVTAIYLFIQTLFWFVGWLAFLAVIVFSTLPHNDTELLWYQLKVNASVLLPAVEYYVLGKWYWRGAPRIAAPLASSIGEPTADERCAPLWIAAVAIWGSTVQLIPATRNLFGTLFLVDFIGFEDDKLLFLVGEFFVRRELGLRMHVVDLTIALLAALAARPLIGLLMRAKRRLHRTPEIQSAAA